MLDPTTLTPRDGKAGKRAGSSRTDRSHRRRKAPASSRRTRSHVPRPLRKTTSGAFVRVDERSLRVRYALHRLPDLTDRSILVLRFFVGLDLEEISERLLLPIRSIRERYLIGLRFMERELGGWL